MPQEFRHKTALGLSFRVLRHRSVVSRYACSEAAFPAQKHLGVSLGTVKVPIPQTFALTRQKSRSWGQNKHDPLDELKTTLQTHTSQLEIVNMGCQFWAWQKMVDILDIPRSPLDLMWSPCSFGSWHQNMSTQLSSKIPLLSRSRWWLVHIFLDRKGRSVKQNQPELRWQTSQSISWTCG